jgi:hypothetical protein
MYLKTRPDRRVCRSLTLSIARVAHADLQVRWASFCGVLEKQDRALIRTHLTVAGNQVQWSWGQHVVAKNISGKPILLFTATLTQIGRHPRGKYAGPGDGPTYELGDDTGSLLRMQ